MGNTRKYTVKLLTKQESDSSFSNLLLDDALARSDFDSRDKKFVSALFYGVLERRYTLDLIITELSKNPKNKLSAEVRNILRTGLYQLLYMDSVPDNAAVDEAVKLAKKNRNPAVSGFVNGMLREFIRKGKKLPEGRTVTERLSIDHSCPLWLVEKWYNELGPDRCKAMLLYSIGQPPTTVRLNTLHHGEEEILDLMAGDGLTFERVSGLRNSFRICFSGAVENTESYKNGLFHVQDLSSQLCCMAVGPKPGDTVLDLCSAPGGKAFTMAEMMEDRGRVMAFDLHPKRVGLIRNGARRLGLSCISAGTNNAKEFNTELPMADKVLVDAPCSGLGVIRRKPEIKYKDPSELVRLPQVQYEILSASAGYVKPGGTLVYSTCTVSKEENEQVAERFLREHEGFSPGSLGDLPVDGEPSMLTVTPDMFGSDGFFIAKFVRRG